jgi:hypothetical protein
MTEHDFKKFHDGLTGVMSFYGKDLSTFALDVWWSALKRYDLPSITSAFNRWLANPDDGQYAPKPAHVIKMLGGCSMDKALQAWAKVDKSIRQVGTYESVVFDDPVIHRVMHEMGGWIGFGQKTEDEWPFVAREFETRYRGYAMRSEMPDYPPVLIGIAEAHNARKALPSEPPRLIGDPKNAEQVMRGGSSTNLIGNTRASAAVMKLVAAS